MRAALYHRVSRLDQNERLARVELRRAAAARRARIVLDIEEKASGARNDREGLQRILQAARRHQVDAVFVWKLDRFGRSLIDLLANVRQLRDAGVRFICVSQGIDLGRDRGDSASELQFNMLAAVAEYERNIIRERTLLGLAAARRRGARIGRPSDWPDPAVVRKLKRRHSWPEVAKKVGKSVMQCRRAAASG